ncbi:hypothetical protein [Verrucosispora sp. FIM060022]|uniref:hypothetical protein n=1 Tax=Verrucosispora sp. FIM060022 TaxID=1479020 RepID=UPI000F897F4A|nr:hypothetical protein [Verrucosispora sp. FIM060022]RUL94548.1 hypothetical protein EG812_02325 [Verrucosispora sp. FIM060022]
MRRVDVVGARSRERVKAGVRQDPRCQAVVQVEAGAEHGYLTRSVVKTGGPITWSSTDAR